MTVIEQENLKKSPSSNSNKLNFSCDSDFAILDDFSFNSNFTLSRYFCLTNITQLYNIVLKNSFSDLKSDNSFRRNLTDDILTNSNRTQSPKKFSSLSPIESKTREFHRKTTTTTTTPDTCSNSAQQKFGSAKGISSDQYFSRESDNLSEASNLSKFHGSTSISSAEYFGRSILLLFLKKFRSIFFTVYLNRWNR